MSVATEVRHSLYPVACTLHLTVRYPGAGQPAQKPRSPGLLYCLQNTTL